MGLKCGVCLSREELEIVTLAVLLVEKTPLFNENQRQLILKFLQFGAAAIERLGTCDLLDFMAGAGGSGGKDGVLERVKAIGKAARVSPSAAEPTDSRAPASRRTS